MRQRADTDDTIDIYRATNTGSPSGNALAARNANGVLLGGLINGHIDLGILNGDCINSVNGVLSDAGYPCGVVVPPVTTADLEHDFTALTFTRPADHLPARPASGPFRLAVGSHRRHAARLCREHRGDDRRKLHQRDR